MSQASLSASHQVAISHDPLEEGASAGFDQLRMRRDDWPSGGLRRRPGMLDLRPALLAGAIGLFAAWLVAGQRRPARMPDARRDLRRRPAPRPARPVSPFGPEGPSSREDLELDALNP